MMSYGPGYILWKEILREREERRIARLEAKRQAARAEPAASGASQPAAARVATGMQPAAGTKRRRVGPPSAVERPAPKTPSARRLKPS